ncbi:MAG TPA: glycosyltransferase [Stellaceae bacterium]|jgi:glycosyltransferase involved in cell wall biosynthesis|nr:glycosyltransferase [Stellaceae bacterium]
MMRAQAARPLVSVVIKALDEAENIGRAIESALVASAGLAAEIIVADALSSDGTAEIAARYPVRVVQLLDAADRSCGCGGQLGFQYSSGAFVLLMDGDMVVEPAFLRAALREMDRDASIGAIGGTYREESAALEFALRRERRGSNIFAIGHVGQITGLGLYRGAALAELGYFTDRNLHCNEEWELGQRLATKGWRCTRLDAPSFRHYGDTLPPAQLLRQRWRSRYVWGSGELVKRAFGTGYFRAALARQWKYLAMIGWWIALVVTAAVSPLAAPVLLLAAPAAAVLWKRAPSAGLYSFALWNLYAAGFVRGVLRPLADPHAPIAARIYADGEIEPRRAVNQ